MTLIRYEGGTYDCRDGETVVDALLRQGVNVPFSCRNGICQVCLRRCTEGAVPENAQKTIRPGLRKLGYFLPCKCVPQGDMTIEPPRDADLFSPAVVHTKEILPGNVCRLLLEPATSLYYHAGQFINVRRPDGLTRSYSLASEPQQDYFLELHVKRLTNGAFSNWIFDELNVGDELEIQGPHGSCYYLAGSPQQNLLLIATGTGLAPLFGVVRDALHNGHTGKIFLYHGSRHGDGLYWHRQLMELAGQYPQLRYNGCLSGDEVPPGFLRGRAHKIAFALHPDLNGWRVYLAGLPEMVKSGETLAMRAGAHPADVFADPFEMKDLRREPRVARRSAGASEERPPPEERREFPPDPEMWSALRNGELLSEILTDFYTRVFDDPVLAPYFRGVTRQRLIEKVYSFMASIYTGQRNYFGDRPRNAHHWMVISDEIFDYRERLMMTVQRAHGLPEHLIQRWRAIEEAFRRDIVKDNPWKRVVGGVEQPLEGFGELEIDVGTLCDGCEREIAAGERVRYHLRLGTTYCRDCTHSHLEATAG